MSWDNKLKLKTYQAIPYTLKSYVYIQGPTIDKTFRQNPKSVSQHTSEKSQSIRTKNSTMTSLVKQPCTNTTILNILSQAKYLQYDKIPIYANMDIHYRTMLNHCLLYTFKVKFYILLWLYILIKSYVNQLWSWKIKEQDLDLPYTFISSAFKLRLNH